VHKGNLSLPISNNNFYIRQNDSGTLVSIQICSSFCPTKGQHSKLPLSNLMVEVISNELYQLSRENPNVIASIVG